MRLQSRGGLPELKFGASFYLLRTGSTSLPLKWFHIPRRSGQPVHRA